MGLLQKASIQPPPNPHIHTHTDKVRSTDRNDRSSQRSINLKGREGGSPATPAALTDAGGFALLEACPLSFVLCRSYAAPRGAAYEGQIVNSLARAGAALPPRLIGIKQIEDCCLCVIEAAGHLGINTPIAPGGVAVMVPDPSPWLRSWISAYPLGSRLFATSLTRHRLARRQDK